MALVVEDGNGLPTANSYADVAYADAYFLARGVTAWGLATTDQRTVALLKGCDYIETVFGDRFIGNRAFGQEAVQADNQALSFPRDTLEAIYGLEKPVYIPDVLKKAQCEYAYRALTNALLPDPVRDTTGAMVIGKTQTVGPISTTVQYYATAGIEITANYPAADLLLKSLIRSGGRTIRG